MNPVAVTGLGVVSPHGDDPQAMFSALMRADSSGMRLTVTFWNGAFSPQNPSNRS